MKSHMKTLTKTKKNKSKLHHSLKDKGNFDVEANTHKI
jgi:hypothetical protein